MTDQPYDIDKLVADAEALVPRIQGVCTNAEAGVWALGFVCQHGEAIIALARDHKAALDALLPFAKFHCDDESCKCHNCVAYRECRKAGRIE